MLLPRLKSSVICGIRNIEINPLPKRYLCLRRLLFKRSFNLSGVTVSKRFGRIQFLLSCSLAAGLSGAVMKLMQAHAGSHRALLAVVYCLALLGVVWIRSLENRLADAGLPRWSFWPYFLIVFTACYGGHALRVASGPELLGLFMLLQLPAVLFQSQPLVELLPQKTGGVVQEHRKPAWPVTQIGAVEFVVYLALVLNLWNVLHLLRSDVNGFAHAKNIRMAMDAVSVLLCLPWLYLIRRRMKALGRLRWAPHFYFLTLIPCLLLFYFRELRFLQALILFAILQIPLAFLRREWMPARLIPEDRDS